MSTIPRSLPDPKINIDTPQQVSSNKSPLNITDTSFYGSSMVAGSRADSLRAVKGMVTQTLGGATGSAKTGANLAGPLGMALFYESYTPGSGITL